MNQSHRHAITFLNLPRKEEAGRAEIQNMLLGCRDPLPTRQLLLRSMKIISLRHRELANPWQVDLLNFIRQQIERSADRQLHVGLSAQHPHIAYQNIPNDNLLITG
ncbi:hypothetical protein D3C81_2087770 [compost metagenome]